MPHPLPTPDHARAWWLVILETCPPGEGMFCLGRVAFADVAPLGQRQPGPWWSGRMTACGTSGGVGWCGLYPICTAGRTGPGPPKLHPRQQTGWWMLTSSGSSTSANVVPANLAAYPACGRCLCAPVDHDGAAGPSLDGGRDEFCEF